ncbi:PREDICTED: transport and Golgi organization protein 2 [Ceratosolen solmsi marchali]|uniref:Transport and Golgi organization protein 2 n=1 Tax=Ceratosolen solmsi marchali TaxID=326594 RepID=A0AAJ6YHZ9_9HYME|nr:PREDICTED: transport and Golgi organization protein 2 [Ceratosolen solmsi marchali]
MCILFIYQNANPSTGCYRLILIANRDEYYERPANPAHFWENYPGCLGGIDMEPGREGGSWLALNYKTGRVGVILNLNGVPKSSVGKGRGFLIRDYLSNSESTEKYATDLHKINQETQAYNPYNFIMVDLRSSSVYYLNSLLNFPGPMRISDKTLAFGNSGIEKPYKKVSIGKENFEKIVNDASTLQQEQLIENLIQFLKLEERHLPDDELKKRSSQAFNELSSIFVRHEIAKYGTRTHSIILVDDNYQITFVEETLEANSSWKRQTFNIHLD